MSPDKIGIPVELGGEMSFPDWAHSYNALYVPLRYWNWQCMLMPGSEAQADGSFWSSLTYEERENKRQERKKQVERDKEDFQRLFSLRIDRYEARRSSEFRLYTDFIRDVLRASGWALPVDGDSVTHVLRNAVRDGLVVPAIDRAWQGGQRVFKHYAPQYWKNPVGGDAGFKAKSEVMRWDDFVALKRANGELPARDSELGDGGGGRGFDWLGVAETVAGAALGGAASGGGDDDSAMLKSFGDGDSGSLLGDAQPFEYQPDLPDGEAFETASQLNRTPNTGEPGTWHTNPGSGQMRLYGDTGAPVIDLDFDHKHNGLCPHAHNWNGPARDGGDDVVPFSPWNP